MNRRLVASAAALSLLNACGGGSHTSVIPNAPPSGGTTTPQSVSVAFRIVLPTTASAAMRRAPAYISGSTASAQITVTPSGASAGTPTLITCSSTVCQGSVLAPLGSDTFAVGLYDSTNNLLSTGSTTQTITANLANDVNITFNGVVAQLSVQMDTAILPAHQTGTIPVHVNAYDADGNLIVGPGVYVDTSGAPVTVTLADSDTSGATQLSQMQLTAPVTDVTLSYVNPTLSLTISGTIGATIEAQASLHIGSIVTLASDSEPGTLAGTGSGVAGDLRYAMQNTPTNGIIVFDTVAMAQNTPSACTDGNCTITLAGPLPPIAQNLTIDGSYTGGITIDGAGTYRAFWAESGDITIAHLTIAHARAKGGNGGNSAGAYNSAGGGGGAGLGAGLFIDSATVNVDNVRFVDDAAVGGNGAPYFYLAGATDGGAGGGGGMGGAGAAAGVDTQTFLQVAGTGGGGGGLLGDGASSASGGGAGGAGFDGIPTAGMPDSTASLTAADGNAGGYGAGGSGGCGVSDYEYDDASLGGNGGDGGMGGGGGGGGLATAVADNSGGGGGKGGFGGGGGAGAAVPFGLRDTGGNGGPGGGGGGGGSSEFSSGGAGKPLSASVGGGNGDEFGNGGGGAAAGPAIFVNTGTLITTNSAASGVSAVGGSAGDSSATGTPAATAGGADATPVFNYGGTVNGSTTTGPIASALSVLPT